MATLKELTLQGQDPQARADWVARVKAIVKHAVADALGEGVSSEAIAKAAARADQIADDVARAALAKYEPSMKKGKIPRLACARGCHMCCHLKVQVRPCDAVRIALHLRKSRSAEALNLLRQKLEAHQETFAAEPDRKLLPCPFLGESRECTVYDVRPLTCRGFHSLSLAKCQKNFANPDAPDVGQPMIPDWFYGTQAVGEALDEALRAHGVSQDPELISTAVLRQLDALSVADGAER